MVGGLVASASMVSAQRDLMGTVFAGGGDQQTKHGRYNILLMGGDAGKDRSGLRPDSMTVASVDAETGRTVLISLPRNLEDVPFPAYLAAAQEVPQGLHVRGPLLHAERDLHLRDHPQGPLPQVPNPGAQATKEAVEGATGPHHQLLGPDRPPGFEDLIDAVGGINMDVYRRVPIGGGGSRSTATSRRARTGTSTAARRCGSPGPGRIPVTTTGWCGRSA